MADETTSKFFLQDHLRRTARSPLPFSHVKPINELLDRHLPSFRNEVDHVD